MRSKVYDQLRAGYEAESRKLAESLLKDGPDHLVSAFVAENTDRLMKVELLSEANGLYFKQLANIRKLKKTLKHVADALDSYLRGECMDCGEECEEYGECVHQKQFRALVKKARDIIAK